MKRADEPKKASKLKQTVGKILKTRRSKFIAVILVAFVVLGGMRVYAETYPGGSENGLTSRLKSLSDDLTGLGYGSNTNSPDWGAMWNRIATAAKWTPNGDTAESDVRNGKTFYGNDRTQKTGSMPAAGPCPTQAWHDNNSSGVTQQTQCVDNINWTTPSPAVTGDDKLDPRTGIVWSHLLRNNGGTVEFNPAASTTWSWDASNANNVAVGNKTAIQLCSDRGNGWRLPTQRELMQAYIDGAYFKLTSPATTHWSSTEYLSTQAWYVVFTNGYTNGSSKTDAYYVRCVR